MRTTHSGWRAHWSPVSTGHRFGRRERTRLLAWFVALLFASTAYVWPGSQARANHTAPIAYHTLSKGSRGLDVVAAQHLLTYWGFSVAADGAFGPATHSKVIQFQASKGLSQDGVVGPATWGKLRVTISQGASGDNVMALTVLLSKWDGGLVHSTFNSSVDTRVRDFQQHMGISVDGIVGPTTWKYLVFHYEQPDAFAVLCKGLKNGSDDFDYDDDAWGTAQTTAFLEKGGNEVFILTLRKVAFRDMSEEHGGDISGHDSHELGMDMDLRPMSTSDYHCNITTPTPGDINYWDPEYHRDRTRWLFNELKKASSDLGRDLHKKTFFNDSVLINQVTEMQKCCADDSPPYSSHDEHLHVRFCTAYYPYDSRYDC